MSKGLILEVNGEEAIVLTAEGEFRSVRKMKQEELRVGDEIEVPHVEVLSFSPKRRKNTISSIALVASFLLVLASVFVLVPIGNDEEAIAFVNLDINPSLEIGLNTSLHVIEIIGLNADGERLAEQLNGLVGKSLYEATREIIVTAKTLGYFESNRDILLTTSFLNDTAEKEYHGQLEEALNQVQHTVTLANQNEADVIGESGQAATGTGSGSASATPAQNTPNQDKAQPTVNTLDSFYIHHVNATKEIRDEAKKHGISTGKYMIYLAAVEQGIEVELESVRDSSISQLVQKFQGIQVVIDEEEKKTANTQQEKQDQNKQKQTQAEKKSAQNDRSTSSDVAQKEKQGHRQQQDKGNKQDDEEESEKSERAKERDREKKEKEKEEEDDDRRNGDIEITITVPSKNILEINLHHNHQSSLNDSEEKKKQQNEGNREKDRERNQSSKRATEVEEKEDEKEKERGSIRDQKDDLLERMKEERAEKEEKKDKKEEKKDKKEKDDD